MGHAKKKKKVSYCLTQEFHLKETVLLKRATRKNMHKVIHNYSVYHIESLETKKSKTQMCLNDVI